MSAYRLEATHSITRDRARETRRSNAFIEIHCTLTVYLLMLQPLIDVLLRNPLSKRRPRSISIHNIRRHRGAIGTAGMMMWTFTVRLYTCDKKVKTHTWWGRRRPLEQIEELPIALLNRLEQALNYTWYRLHKSPDVFSKRRAALQMLN